MDAVWEPTKERKRLQGSDGGKEGGAVSVQEKSSSSISSETSDSTSSSADGEVGMEIEEVEEEDPMMKKHNKTRWLSLQEED